MSVKSILELALLVFKSVYLLSLNKEYLFNKHCYILYYYCYGPYRRSVTTTCDTYRD